MIEFGESQGRKQEQEGRFLDRASEPRYKTSKHSVPCLLPVPSNFPFSIGTASGQPDARFCQILEVVWTCFLNLFILAFLSCTSSKSGVLYVDCGAR